MTKHYSDRIQTHTHTNTQMTKQYNKSVETYRYTHIQTIQRVSTTATV